MSACHSHVSQMMHNKGVRSVAMLNGSKVTKNRTHTNSFNISHVVNKQNHNMNTTTNTYSCNQLEKKSSAQIHTHTCVRSRTHLFVSNELYIGKEKEKERVKEKERGIGRSEFPMLTYFFGLIFF